MTRQGSVGALKGTGVRIGGANMTDWGAHWDHPHPHLSSDRHGTEAQGGGQICLRPHKSVPGHCLPSPDWGGGSKAPHNNPLLASTEPLHRIPRLQLYPQPSL